MNDFSIGNDVTVPKDPVRQGRHVGPTNSFQIGSINR
jgi:hypothetical protein